MIDFDVKQQIGQPTIVPSQGYWIERNSGELLKFINDFSVNIFSINFKLSFWQIDQNCWPLNYYRSSNHYRKQFIRQLSDLKQTEFLIHFPDQIHSIMKLHNLSNWKEFLWFQWWIFCSNIILFNAEIKDILTSFDIISSKTIFEDMISRLISLLLNQLIFNERIF